MRSLTIALILGACLRGQDSGAPPPNYTFAPIAELNEPRDGACLLGLGDGRALAIGGQAAGQIVGTVELFTPDAGWNRVASMSVARIEHTCTLLPDGRVMVAGGRGPAGSTGVLEFYAPADDAWQRLSSSMLPRWRHTATVLSDGRVLLAGGQSESRIFDTLEVIDPWFDTLTLLNVRLRIARSGHAAAPLPGGGALIVGGFNTSGFLTESDIYVSAGRIDPGATLPEGAADLSATVLLDDRILVAGGRGSVGEVAAAFLYDPARNTFQSLAPMPAPRAGHSALLLEGNGRVLIAGGIAAEQPLASTLLFDPVAGTWENAGDAIGATGLKSAAQAAPGAVIALGELPQAMAVPAIRLERSFYTADQVVRVSFSNFGSPDAVLTAATVQTTPVTVERTLPTAEGMLDFMQVAPETAGRRWQLTALGAADGKPIRAAFLQKSKVFLTFTPQPEAPLSYESAQFAYSLTRESGRLGMAWAPSLLLRVTGTSEGASTSSFSTEFSGDQPGPNHALAGGSYVMAARLSSLNELYVLEGVVVRTDLTVKRRTPFAVDFTLPAGVTGVGELRQVTASVRTGLPASIPRPSGVVNVSRGGFKRGEIRIPIGSFGLAGANLALGQVGSFPVEFAYAGDHNYAPVTSTSNPFTIQKGNVGLALKAVKPEFIVGEEAFLDATITHPKVLGAAPTGQIIPVAGPIELTLRGGVLGTDPANTGAVVAQVSAGKLPFARANNQVAFTYTGDANFNAIARPAVANVAFDRSIPIITVKAPEKGSVGQTIIIEVVGRGTDAIPDLPPPTGVVQLFRSGQPISSPERSGTMLARGSEGLALIEVGPFPSPGTYDYTIWYRGTTTYVEYTSPVFRITVE